MKGSLGRNRPFEKQATLEKVYPSIFIVKYDENQRNVTYSYTDILTRTVELQVFDGESYSSIIPPEPEGKKKEKNMISDKIKKKSRDKKFLNFRNFFCASII